MIEEIKKEIDGVFENHPMQKLMVWQCKKLIDDYEKYHQVESNQKYFRALASLKQLNLIIKNNRDVKPKATKPKTASRKRKSTAPPTIPMTG